MNYGAEPQYRQIYNKLRQDIATGRYPVGGIMPGDKQMAEIFSVNPLTIRSALTRLVDEGYIIRHRGRGRGTTVLRKPESEDEKERKLQKIGLLIPNQDGPNREFVRGIESVITYQNVQLVKLERPENTAVSNSADFARWVMDQEIDGLIVFGSFNQPELSEQITEAECLEQLKIPVVILDRHEFTKAVDCVCVDDKTGMKMAAEHLLSLGHGKVVYIRFKEQSLRHKARLAGFREACEEVGDVTAEEVMLPSNDRIGNLKLLTEYFSANKNRFTACLSGNDSLADLVMGALATNNVSVPKDMAVMGYDCLSSTYAPLNHQGISSVDRQRFEVGKNAANRLLARLADPELTPGVKIILQPRLVIGATCGGKRSEHPGECNMRHMDY